MNLKHSILASCLTLSFALNAQNEQDAVLYSTTGSGASARTLGMAGAFSAIGADPSAAMINPAGIAQMRRNLFDMGIQFINFKSYTRFYSTDAEDGRLNFNMPNMDLVLAKVYYDGSGKPRKQGLANITFGFHIHRLANLHSRMTFEADNKQSSITDYFAMEANRRDQYPDELDLGYLESLAYSSGAIENLVTGGGAATKQYVSRYIDSNRNAGQVGTRTRRGNIYENQFSFGANFSHKISLGLGLVYTTLKLNDEFDLLETDKQTRSKPDLEKVSYHTQYIDRGNGFGARIGAIFRPNDQLRLGVSLHTPRTYSINTRFRYDIKSTFENGANSQKEVRAWTDGYNIASYRVTTPARVIAALGFVFGTKGLANAEVEFYDYSAARMKADDDAYTAENQNIRTMYKSVMIFRLGTEINIPDKENKDIAYRVRLGYANYPSQFSSKAAGIDPILKKARNVIAAGFGYREKDYYLDMSVTYGSATGYFTPYITGTSVFPATTVTHRQTDLGLTVTVGFNFE